MDGVAQNPWSSQEVRFLEVESSLSLEKHEQG